MSLINEMLRDLETRRAGELGKPDLQREIRPLPGRRQAFSYPLLMGSIGLLLAVAVGAGVWWQADLWFERKAVRELAAGSEVQSTSVIPSPMPAEASAAAITETLRLAVELSSPPIEAASSERVKALPMNGPLSTGVSATIKGTAIPARDSADRAPVKPGGGPAAPAIEGNIEKTVVLGTPRERADAEYRRAKAMLEAGGAMLAVVEVLHGALRQDGTYSQARQLLLKILLESRRIDEALALLQEGLEQQPNQIGWAMSLARLLVERGDVKAGERALARFQPYGTGSAEYLGFHGHLLNRLGQFREAVEQYTMAAGVAPADGRWWFGLGLAQEGSGRGEEARSAFRRALEAGNLNADLMALAEQKIR